MELSDFVKNYAIKYILPFTNSIFIIKRMKDK